MKTAVALLSGGVDSYLSTAIARDRYKIALALTFDYAQRSILQEIKAARRMTQTWNIRHEVVELPWLQMLGKSALTHKGNRLPRFFEPSKLKSKKVCNESAEAVWVPNRNGLLINIAAAYAESLGSELIVTGFNREEAATFSDNSIEYVRKINAALALSTFKNPPKVKSFVQEMNKMEMMSEMLKRNLSFDVFWSCYEGNEKMCGTCESCARSLAAIKANDLLEKVGYRFSEAVPCN